MATPFKLRRGFVVVALVGLGLLLAGPWATRRRVSLEVADELVATSRLVFERPPVRAPVNDDRSVVECLERALPAASLARPPAGLSGAFGDGGAWPDGSATWVEAQRKNVEQLRACLGAPAVGPFDFDCDVGAPLPRGLLLQVGLTWLRGEVSGAFDGGAPLSACLDVTALERDAPALHGLVGAMQAAASARSTLEPCARALAQASASDRRLASETFARLRATSLPIASVMRLERGITGVSAFGGALRRVDLERLPLRARGCAGRQDVGSRWLLLPSVWERLRALERVAEGDPLLASPEAEQLLSEPGFLEALANDPFMIPWPRFARRYTAVALKLDALLALDEGLAGAAPRGTPALKVTPHDGGLTLEVGFEEGWTQVDVSTRGGSPVTPR